MLLYLQQSKAMTKPIFFLLFRIYQQSSPKMFSKTSFSVHLNFRYFVCTLIRLGSYYDLGIGLYESRLFFRLSKCLLPSSFQLKITSPLPPPAQCCYGWFKERFLLSQQVRKPKSNIDYREERGGRAKYCEKYLFPKIYVEDCSSKLLLNWT